MEFAREARKDFCNLISICCLNNVCELSFFIFFFFFFIGDVKLYFN